MSLTYITRKEYRVGLDASLFNGLVSVNTNFFHQTTSGLLTQGASTVYPSFYNSGLGDFLPYINYNQDRRVGVDYAVTINKSYGDWDFSLGFVGMVLNTKATKRDEVAQEDYLYTQSMLLMLLGDMCARVSSSRKRKSLLRPSRLSAALCVRVT